MKTQRIYCGLYLGKWGILDPMITDDFGDLVFLTEEQFDAFCTFHDGEVYHD